jgi:hypothetical protein
MLLEVELNRGEECGADGIELDRIGPSMGDIFNNTVTVTVTVISSCSPRIALHSIALHCIPLHCIALHSIE